MSRGDFNSGVISEFRANHGRVGGAFDGAPLLLLHTVGARSGQARVTPVMYLQDGDRYVVFASKGGAPDDPGWYHNLRANPDARVEIGDRTIDVRAVEVEGPARDALFDRQAARFPAFAGYQHQTSRVIPVVALSERGMRSGSAG